MRSVIWWSSQKPPSWYPVIHDSDVIMDAVASPITSLTLVYSTVYSNRRSKKTSKLRVTGLCAGNSPGTGEFPTQRASNAKNVSIWWRHHVIVKPVQLEYRMPSDEITSFTKEVYPRLAKRPLKTNGHLATLELLSLVKRRHIGGWFWYDLQWLDRMIMQCMFKRWVDRRSKKNCSVAFHVQ